MFRSLVFIVSIVGATTFAAAFREYPVGDPIEINKLKVAAVYFPAVPMDHASLMAGMTTDPNHSMNMDVSEADIAKEKFAKPGNELIHLECDIHATKGNPNGFGAGEWIPYLNIKYTLRKAASKDVLLSGDLMPMVANDGPHYGTTIRMPGKGKYTLTYEVSPPALARHTDKLTGVAPYWKNFVHTYSFNYEGIPK